MVTLPYRCISSAYHSHPSLRNPGASGGFLQPKNSKWLMCYLIRFLLNFGKESHRFHAPTTLGSNDLDNHLIIDFSRIDCMICIKTYKAFLDGFRLCYCFSIGLFCLFLPLFRHLNILNTGIIKVGHHTAMI